ncbi:MAG: hypothetical protein M1389_10410 [Chloroflexi bacterium]|nr:hypothetical protein [Chloroflexota bacterium]
MAEERRAAMHPNNTGPWYRDPEGHPAHLVRCPFCGRMEWWTEAECREHGKCRDSSDPCPVCGQ